MVLETAIHVLGYNKLLTMIIRGLDINRPSCIDISLTKKKTPAKRTMPSYIHPPNLKPSGPKKRQKNENIFIEETKQEEDYALGIGLYIEIFLKQQ